MLLLSMIPAASAFAAQNNPYISSVTTEGSGLNFSATSVHKPGLHIWYQFRIEKNGHWYIFQKFSKSNTVMLPANTKGTAVEAYAITQYEAQHHLWKYQVQASNNLPVTPVASLSITGASNESTSGGTEILTAVAKDAAGNVIANPGTVTWSITPTSGAMINPLASGNSAAFSATAGGSYTVTAALNGKTTTTTIVVYGTPAAVKLTSSAPTITADGAATDTVTAAVVDSSGNTVSNFNGTIALSDTGNATAIVDPSNSNSQGTYETATATDGVATFTVVSTGTAAGVTDTLTANANAPDGVALTAGTTTIKTVAATPTALSLSASPSTLDVNNGGTSTQVSISVNDQAGNPLSGISEPVHLTISGPGTFAPGESVTSTATYIDGSGTITVYGEQNGTGTITVTATSGSMKAGSTTIRAVTVGEPAQLQIKSSAQTTSNGTPFELYTVQVEDANGNPITSGNGASDLISISDNTGTVGGSLSYYAYTGGAPGAAIPSTVQLVNGQYQFAVENTSAGSGPATITVKDVSHYPNFSATALYPFHVGSASKVSLSPSTNQYVEAGQKVTVTAQLTDANGNSLTTPGQPVTFYFASNSADAMLPNGLSGSGSDNGFTTTTNAQGVATVTIAVGSNTGAFQVAAQVGSNGAVMGPTYTVEPLVNYATGDMFVTTLGGTTPYDWPSDNTIGAGTNLSGVYVSLTNGVGELAHTNDSFQVTTSNPNVLELAGGNYASGTNNQVDVTAMNGSFAMPSIRGLLAGTATVTVTDLSNPNVAPLRETLTVNPSTQVSGYELWYNGQPISGNNPLTLSAGVPVQLQVAQVDAGGNPIMVTGSPVDVALSVGSHATFSGTFEVGSQAVSTVQIPIGSEFTNVSFVPEADTTLTAENTNTTLDAMAVSTAAGNEDATINVTNAATGTAPGSVIPPGETLNISGQVQSGSYVTGQFHEKAPVPNQPITISLGGDTTNSNGYVEATTNANGYYSVSLTPSQAKTARHIDVWLGTLTPGSVTNTVGKTTYNLTSGFAQGNHVASSQGQIAVAGPLAQAMFQTSSAHGNDPSVSKNAFSTAAGGTFNINATPQDSNGTPLNTLGTQVGASEWNLGTSTGAMLTGITQNADGTYTLAFRAIKSASATPNMMDVYYGDTKLGTLAETVTADVGAPTDIEANSTTSGTTVTWHAPRGTTPSSYQVWAIPMVKNVAGKGIEIASGVSGKKTSYSAAGLTVGDSYEFNVDAVDQYGNVVKGTPSKAVAIASDLSVKGIAMNVTKNHGDYPSKDSITATGSGYSWQLAIDQDTATSISSADFVSPNTTVMMAGADTAQGPITVDVTPQGGTSSAYGTLTYSGSGNTWTLTPTDAPQTFETSGTYVLSANIKDDNGNYVPVTVTLTVGPNTAN